MTKTHKITMMRHRDIEDVSMDSWRNFIADLVLLGYEVCGDENSISFDLGWDDEVKEIDR